MDGGLGWPHLTAIADAFLLRNATKILKRSEEKWVLLADAIIRSALRTSSRTTEIRNWTTSQVLLGLNSFKTNLSPTLDRMLATWFKTKKRLRWVGGIGNFPIQASPKFILEVARMTGNFNPDEIKLLAAAIRRARLKNTRDLPVIAGHHQSLASFLREDVTVITPTLHTALTSWRMRSRPPWPPNLAGKMPTGGRGLGLLIRARPITPGLFPLPLEKPTIMNLGSSRTNGTRMKRRPTGAIDGKCSGKDELHTGPKFDSGDTSGETQRNAQPAYTQPQTTRTDTENQSTALAANSMAPDDDPPWTTEDMVQWDQLLLQEPRDQNSHNNTARRRITRNGALDPLTIAVFDRVVAVVIEGGIPGVRMAVLMQHLAEKGGTRRQHVNSNTTHIVANSWKHVEERFEHNEKMLKRVAAKFKIVHFDWLTECLKAGVTVEEQDFSLVPNAERDAREEAAALLLQQQLFEEEEDLEIEKIVESLRKAQARAEAKNLRTP
ncbi:hypothetical protein R1sor_025837 [Riccia sorocarpa]|uniref:BRCT domain-containing protein n=1 Tax=Riccia sorocarpa TaxID=122646 RepID=A0ABD3GFC5_9MARC